MAKNYHDITTALAGVFQAATLVKQLAHTGECDQTAFASCIHSIYQLDANNVASVYGTVPDLSIGKKQLQKLLASKQTPDVEITRYVFAILYLQKQLMKNKSMLSELRQRLRQTHQQLNYFTEIHSTMIGSLADIYLSTISTFKMRVQVVGRQENLQVESTMEKIRALLLAAVRSAVLWQQVGGTRWQLLLQRSRLLEEIKHL